MTTPITKEQLREYTAKKVKSLKFAITQSAFTGITEGLEKELQLAEFALAAMDAEPVADVVAWHKEGEERTCDIRWRRFDVAPGPLFAVAQPVPVVPDELADNIDSDDHPLLWSYNSGWNACRAAMLNHSENEHDMVERVSQPYKLPEEKGASLQLRNLIRKRHAEWSDATFGNVGPIGPLKHLSKEALEAAAEPDDLSEWADMQFLLWDAQRRAGISDGEITAAMEEKLKVNMARQWPEPKDGEPRMHIMEPGNSPVIPDGWIAVSERMPEMRTPVWCFGSIPEVSGKEFGFEGWLTTGGFVAENNSSSPGGCEKAIVTHWMPLPAAPQQEGK